MLIIKKGLVSKKILRILTCVEGMDLGIPSQINIMFIIDISYIILMINNNKIWAHEVLLIEKMKRVVALLHYWF